MIAKRFENPYFSNYVFLPHSEQLQSRKISFLKNPQSMKFRGVGSKISILRVVGISPRGGTTHLSYNDNLPFLI
jgi:hypothetical protein